MCFLKKISQKTKNVKVIELWAVLNDEKRWLALDDEDAVRVCLLVVCKLVFMDREEFLNMPPYLLTLAKIFWLEMHILGRIHVVIFLQKNSECGS